MQPVARKMLFFVRKVRERVPELAYVAYVREGVPPTAVYLYGFDSNGALEGGYEIDADLVRGLVPAAVLGVARFLSFAG